MLLGISWDDTRVSWELYWEYPGMILGVTWDDIGSILGMLLEVS